MYNSKLFAGNSAKGKIFISYCRGPRQGQRVILLQTGQTISIFRDITSQKKYNPISKVTEFFIDTHNPSLYICRCFDTTQQHERE
jgi:hypothetical protein